MITDLANLSTAIYTLDPSERVEIQRAFDKIVESSQRQTRIVGVMEEALCQIRLDIKYLLFDLDATRKERDDYRAQLQTPEDTSKPLDDRLGPIS